MEKTAARKEYMRNYMRKYISKNREKWNSYNSALRENNRQRENQRRRDWKDQNKEKHLCHVRVYKAIQSGKLTKGVCGECGDKNVHAHHHDYSKPLDVSWLCPIHHSSIHKKTA